MASRGSEQPGEARFALGDGNGRYVLVWLTQLARSDACSANPYRGAIGELAVEPGRVTWNRTSDDELVAAAQSG